MLRLIIGCAKFTLKFSLFTFSLPWYFLELLSLYFKFNKRLCLPKVYSELKPIYPEFMLRIPKVPKGTQRNLRTQIWINFDNENKIIYCLQWRNFYYRTFFLPIHHFLVTFYLKYTIKCDKKQSMGPLKIQ